MEEEEDSPSESNSTEDSDESEDSIQADSEDSPDESEDSDLADATEEEASPAAQQDEVKGNSLSLLSFFINLFKVGIHISSYGIKANSRLLQSELV